MIATLQVLYPFCDIERLRKYDAAIRSAVGKESNGSGAGEGMRDLSFDLESRDAAEKARWRILLLRIPDVKVVIDEYDEKALF